MKVFSEVINEAQTIKLSKDWEVIWSDWHESIARDFLKKMDERASKLNITTKLAERAVKEFWSGNFPKALKLIWGDKLRSTKEVLNGGIKEVYTYIVKGYGTFVETYEQSVNAYSHKIELRPENEEMSCYDLNNVMICSCSRKGAGDFAQVIRQTEQQAYQLRSNHILNCLFIGFCGKDLAMTLTGIKRKNKIM